jgi:pimeloyl-ACP methyl ester carboxylesterase
MNNKMLLVALALALFGCDENEMEVDFKGQTIELVTADSLTIKADVYKGSDDEKPIIIMFHQAGYSRGEYRPIAHWLSKDGYTCIAIDQRSGEKVNGVVNSAFAEANEKSLPTEYIDAYPDLETALLYASSKYKNRKIIIWGSSYSASLVFVLGAKYPELIDGLVAFSPGEYFNFENRSIKDYASEVTCPVFISSAKNEKEAWSKIYQNVKSESKRFYLPEKDGYHGSKSLWEINDGNEKCWEALKQYLSEIK